MVTRTTRRNKQDHHDRIEPEHVERSMGRSPKERLPATDPTLAGENDEQAALTATSKRNKVNSPQDLKERACTK